MKTVRRFFSLLLLSVIAVGAHAQFSVGVRATKYVYGEYALKKHYVFRLEQSVYSEKLGYQYIRLYAGYKGRVDKLTYSGEGFFGTAYNGDYYNCGALINAKYDLLQRLYTEDALEFLYDSGYGFKTCFRGGLGFQLCKNIDILAAYSSIPEYRKSEDRALIGFQFHSGTLSVRPELSIALKGVEKIRSLRTMVSMRYEFRTP